MQSPFETAPDAAAIPIIFATKTTWAGIASELPEQARQFAAANDFTAKPGKCLTLPAPDGTIAQVVFGLEDETSKSRDLFRPGALPGLLPPGVYRFANAPHDVRLATLAFALGTYRFGRYRKSETPDVRLVPPDGVDVADIARMAEAAALARDLINTPSNDMGPEELAQAAQALGDAVRRQVQLHRRRRTPEAELSADPRRRHGLDARPAPDRPELGRSCPSQGDAGRQGRLLRHRRPRPETVQRHADHEKGHGRRRQRAGAGADGDGCRS